MEMIGMDLGGGVRPPLRSFDVPRRIANVSQSLKENWLFWIKRG